VADVALQPGPQCADPQMRSAIANINWKLIAFWVLLWWFVYSAPTEGSLTQLLSSADVTSQADTF